MPAVVLVSVPGVGISVALRVAGGLRVLDVLDMISDLLGPLVRCGQIIKWVALRFGREGKARGRRLLYPDNSNGRIQIKCIAESMIG